ncbi:LamG-like jellyroll fold domain-containing protein [Actinoplanes subglobosus]|uniref:LamG-like jellyroll fold domain-containing protein n=1 Tax=Actinoplanes subglobosus TaxID=1547892 RepID=A0ABV8J0G2_9ACTN
MLVFAVFIVVMLVVPGAVVPRGPGGSSSAVWVTPGVPPVETIAWYGFEGPEPWADLTAFTGNDGRVRWVPHGPGQAVRFPSPCSREPCPRLILRALNRPELNPGTAPFSFGATVRLSPRHTTDGQNVLQKGYAVEGSQYKLQIDGSAGRPSCVLVGAGSRRIHLVIADVGVADGAWHRLACRRGPATLGILVDGVPRAGVPIPAGLRIDNAMSLNVGGKSAHGDNDQFHGAVDDVWITRP